MSWTANYTQTEDTTSGTAQRCAARAIETVRQHAGIATPVLPPHFSSIHVYDKWGNRCTEHGLRESGPLGQDTGMLRALQAGGFRGLLVPAP